MERRTWRQVLQDLPMLGDDAEVPPMPRCRLQEMVQQLTVSRNYDSNELVPKGCNFVAVFDSELTGVPI